MKSLRWTIAFVAAGAAAQQAQETVVVTATRLPQPGFDLPASIDAVDSRVIREDTPMVNLSETLNRVPGIVVANRQNYAQDLQVSSRGFGARSTFGVRGVRLIADGIPATAPDGQGQAATFDLSAADRIEVLRGPFASLYGNSSGGVIQFFTMDGPPRPELLAGYTWGSFGMFRANLRFGGEYGGLNYLVDGSHFETDGYRDHSSAMRNQVNGKLRIGLGPGTLTFVANYFDTPEAQDPGGLTRAQYEQNPRQADITSTIFNTRKSIAHNQAGLVYDVSVTPQDTLNARLYGGNRQVTQYLGQTGDTPLGSGGVVDLDRNFGGVGLRWSRVMSALARPLTFSLGAEDDRQDEHRTGFVNNNGVAGALRRDEDDRVESSDVYGQFEWTLTPQWIVSGGARYSHVKFDSKDHYIVGPNPDDSGSVTFTHTVPVAGILFKPSEDVRLYANAGEGFETPTFAELAYRPGGGTGLNFDLQPSKSKHYEVGAKAKLAPNVRASIAAFHIDTRDEIVTNNNIGGRSDFKNASGTRRVGGEAWVEAKMAYGFEGYVSYTGLSATFTEPFTSGTPPVKVPAGNRLPGVPGNVLQYELIWRHQPWGFHTGLEFRHSSKVYVNEANTDAANKYNVVNLRAGFEQRGSRWHLREFARADNVTDRHYIGSVIVAEARGRFFEPAPGRNYTYGIEGSYSF
ncbi:MAG TPA: TonB-dependent receptor [Usitatibacter sp.]|nr:TonB-dependent receptor [Usitatibacter sp.]